MSKLNQKNQTLQFVFQDRWRTQNLNSFQQKIAKLAKQNQTSNLELGRATELLLEQFLDQNSQSKIASTFSVSVDCSNADLAPNFMAMVRESCLESFYDELLMLPLEKPKSNQIWLAIDFLPGVTNNQAKAAKEALYLSLTKKLPILKDLQNSPVISVETGLLIILESRKDLAEAKKDLIQNQNLSKQPWFLEAAAGAIYNPLLQSLRVIYTNASDTENKIPINNHTVGLQTVNTVNLNVEDQELLALSQKNCWALSLEEMKAIAHYFKTKHGHCTPSDVEIEILAQTWSEHCKHKIFNSYIEYKEEVVSNRKLVAIKDQTIDGPFKSFVRRPSLEVIEKFKIPWAVSLFKDNAGIVRFDSKLDLCIKVETHNSPSALDPYGGALTGILGVNRDIMGTGMGARPVANMNVLCFAARESVKLSHHRSETVSLEKMPVGPLDPKQVLRGVHKGIEDGGNKSGIPTINGAIYFHPSFCGKPLVYCGTIGVLPPVHHGESSARKVIEVGDVIVMAGGKIGRDGIHGATMSSLKIDETVPLSVVQIGDPLTQKRLCDFQIRARDLNLYRALTDNGAGGLSSSLGEMAQITGGAEIYLDRCQLKYPGLAPWEIMVSESQERMSYAVPKDKVDQFLSLAKQYDVDCSVLGKFTDSGQFHVYFNQQTVAQIEMEFLHQGVPQLKLKAFTDGQFKELDGFNQLPVLDGPNSNNKNPNIKNNGPFTLDHFSEELTKLLSSLNVTSKWPLVSQYDHEVQGATLVRPFAGMNGAAPYHGGGIWAHPLGGEKENVFLTGNGLAPRWSLFDPYWMAVMSVDESVRNILVHGADPEYIALLDNFCWPDPTSKVATLNGDPKLGMLVRALHGLKDTCLALGMPLISGKDSMKNDYKIKPNKTGSKEKAQDGEIEGEKIISALPTLLATSLGKATLNSLMRSQVRADINLSDYTMVRIGPTKLFLSCSEYAAQKNMVGDSRLIAADDGVAIEIHSMIPHVRDVYLKIHHWIKNKKVAYAADISEGGLAVTMAEFLFHNPQFTFDCNLEPLLANKGSNSDFEMEQLLFGEGPFTFMLMLHNSVLDKIHLPHTFSMRPMGTVSYGQFSLLNIKHQQTSITLTGKNLFKAWSQGLGHYLEEGGLESLMVEKNNGNFFDKSAGSPLFWGDERGEEV